MADPQNLLIERLPRADRLRLLAICEPVQFVLADVLGEPNRPTQHVYFPVDGFISLVSLIDGRASVEVGMVGREGMLGAQVALGVAKSPVRALVQGPGAAWRIDARPFCGELARSAALQSTLQHYLSVLMVQLTTSAACLRFHSIGQRLARWLLMCQDRAHGDRFYVTHEVLAYMLGVRRVGITVAAGTMRRSGLIKYHRGDFTVLDRHRLEAAACGCYAVDCAAYAELMMPPLLAPISA
jgi:CRP-like cAMP-binding protein